MAEPEPPATVLEREPAMTTTARRAPHFVVRSATSTARAIFLAALCAFIVTSFLIDVQRGVTRPDAPAAEQRT
jgi:hypothetical protein